MEFMVSVIVPIYNMEKYLEGCLNSILNQTLKEIEIICVDDGSTDGTGNILRCYTQRYSNIVVFQQEREGSGAARNKGIENAKGKFIAFMDPDDYYPSDDVLETLVAHALEHNVQAAGGNCQLEIEGTCKPYIRWRIEKDRVIDYEDYQEYCGHTRFIYSKELLKKNSIVYPPYVRAQDLIFMLKALSCAGKIWITVKDTYVVRVIDKKINYSSSRVISDIARGVYDVIHFSRQHSYKKIIEDLVLEIQKWKIHFFLHVLGENQELYGYLKKMNVDITTSGYTKGSQYYLDMSVDDMKRYMSEYTDKIRRYIKIMEQYEEVIIYGAGNIGKAVFDIIESRDNIKFGGFAVSRDVVNSTARGKEIHCINRYIEKKNTALVIIASKNEVSGEMEKNTSRLDFKNVLVINEELVDVDKYEIANDRFAV